jgi:protein TonB
LVANAHQLITIVKLGNYKLVEGGLEIYYINKEKKAYYKYKNLDTLYTMDYSSDTSRIVDVVKSDSLTEVNHHPCKSVLFRTNSYTLHYLYSNDFYINPEYDKGNTLGHLDHFVEAANGGVWLSLTQEFEYVTVSHNCIHIEQKPIDNHVFDLPDLPRKNMQDAKLFRPAKFKGDNKAWESYLRNNLNASLGIKYIKLPKGENSQSQKVMVNFMVQEDGSISDIKVSNASEVHPKLADEAMRVIRESPNWMPATFAGEKMVCYITQPVVFAVDR